MLSCYENNSIIEKLLPLFSISASSRCPWLLIWSNRRSDFRNFLRISLDLNLHWWILLIYNEILFVNDVPLGIARSIKVINIPVFFPLFFDSLILFQVGVPLLEIQFLNEDLKWWNLWFFLIDIPGKISKWTFFSEKVLKVLSKQSLISSNSVILRVVKIC